MFTAKYIENGWRYRPGCNGAPIGNGSWGLNGHLTLQVLNNYAGFSF